MDFVLRKGYFKKAKPSRSFCLGDEPCLWFGVLLGNVPPPPPARGGATKTNNQPGPAPTVLPLLHALGGQRELPALAQKIHGHVAEAEGWQRGHKWPRTRPPQDQSTAKRLFFKVSWEIWCVSHPPPKLCAGLLRAAGALPRRLRTVSNRQNYVRIGSS